MYKSVRVADPSSPSGFTFLAWLEEEGGERPEEIGRGPTEVEALADFIQKNAVPLDPLDPLLGLQ